MADIKIIRSYVKNVGILYSFQVQSIIKGDKEGRRLRLDVGSETYYFYADSFIAQYISKYAENKMSSFGLGALISTCDLAFEWAKDKAHKTQIGTGLEFPFSIIIQIAVYVVLELIRYIRNRKMYDRIERKWFDDNVSTYSENEYCGFEDLL